MAERREAIKTGYRTSASRNAEGAVRVVNGGVDRRVRKARSIEHDAFGPHVE
jgi:hypothetical protein